jgi:hypothetical protein
MWERRDEPIPRLRYGSRKTLSARGGRGGRKRIGDSDVL